MVGFSLVSEKKRRGKEIGDERERQKSKDKRKQTIGFGLYVVGKRQKKDVSTQD